MKNRTINLGVVAEIAEALGELNKSVVFVGGAIVSVYADDPAADEIRPTQDVDLTLTLIDFNQQVLDTQLAKLGFHPDIHGHVICSYRYNDISVDIMAATDTMRGPTNRWYQIGFESLQRLSYKGHIFKYYLLLVIWQQNLKRSIIEAKMTIELVTILKILFISWTTELVS